jgi:hypothetical protein
MFVPVHRVFNNVSRNLGLENYTNNIDAWAEWAFEAEQYIGSNKTFLQKEIVYSSTPEAAFGSIEIATNPTDMSYIDINGTRFFFVSSTIVGDDFYIDIKSTVYLTLQEAVDVINKSLYDNIQGIKASTSGSVLTLTCQENGDWGNHLTLDSDIGKVTAFAGGKEMYHNNQVRLPDNMVKMLSVKAGGTIIFPTSSQFKSSVSENSNKYYVNGNRLNLTNTYTKDVTVSYLAVPMSEEGYPMVKQGHEEAVASYIMWKHKLITYYSGETPQYIIKDLERRWYQLCGKVRGDDNMPNSSELLKIGKVWNSKTRPRLYDGLNNY